MLVRNFVRAALLKLSDAEETLQWCFYKNVFWKYATNLQENTHAEARF